MAKAAADTESDRTEGLMALARRAEGGDASALTGLREVLGPPEIVELAGDLDRWARLTLVERLCGKNLLAREAVTRKLALMRDELCGPAPTPVERLLVERVVLCWLHLHHLEAGYAGKEGNSLAVGAHYQRALSAAQRRYLAAIKALATVRKLAVPVLQVNIAKRQVNAAGPCTAAGSP